MPELELPDCSDAALLANRAQWLQPAFAGKSRLDALDEASFGEALKSPLEWSQRQLVERHAPTRITRERRTAAAGAGGETAGTVRPGRHPTHRRWPRAVDPAPALAWRPPTAGHPGPAQFLGKHLRRSEEGNDGPLPAPSVAG
ncbi:hypothetical protein G6F32_015822 [Rhizopus arrhizus]|nr:hypothetical protein G6F32_015822 [Rhizopus arrhizus]